MMDLDNKCHYDLSFQIREVYWLTHKMTEYDGQGTAGSNTKNAKFHSAKGTRIFSRIICENPTYNKKFQKAEMLSQLAGLDDTNFRQEAWDKELAHCKEDGFSPLEWAYCVIRFLNWCSHNFKNWKAFPEMKENYLPLFWLKYSISQCMFTYS